MRRGSGSGSAGERLQRQSDVLEGGAGGRARRGWTCRATARGRREQDYAGDGVEVVFDAELSRGLKALAQRHGSTLYMTLLAGWAALLARLSGQDEVVIGSPVAGRARAETEPLIGFFVNTLAMRLKVGRDVDGVGAAAADAGAGARGAGARGPAVRAGGGGRCSRRAASRTRRSSR